MKFSIDLTWSKIMALFILIAAFCLDFFVIKAATTTMFALPFLVFLITGKQWIDKK